MGIFNLHTVRKAAFLKKEMEEKYGNSTFTKQQTNKTVHY
jgi:hypothetical protein